MSWRPAFCHMRTRSVFSGERKYMLDLPVVPGCGANGRVRAVGPDATRLAVGDWVSCDPTVRARDDGLTPDITLQGWSARCEGGLRLQRYFRHGSFAEQIRVPTEKAVPIGPIELADAGRWCAMTLCLVPYGGLLAANLRAGETVLISGATGNFGSAGVAVALAWGRAASSRRAATRRCWRISSAVSAVRVRTVKLTGVEAQDGERMKRSPVSWPACARSLTRSFNKPARTSHGSPAWRPWGS